MSRRAVGRDAVGSAIPCRMAVRTTRGRAESGRACGCLPPRPSSPARARAAGGRGRVVIPNVLRPDRQGILSGRTLRSPSVLEGSKGSTRSTRRVWGGPARSSFAAIAVGGREAPASPGRACLCRHDAIVSLCRSGEVDQPCVCATALLHGDIGSNTRRRHELLGLHVGEVLVDLWHEQPTVDGRNIDSPPVMDRLRPGAIRTPLSLRADDCVLKNGVPGGTGRGSLGPGLGGPAPGTVLVSVLAPRATGAYLPAAAGRGMVCTT